MQRRRAERLRGRRKLVVVEHVETTRPLIAELPGGFRSEWLHDICSVQCQVRRYATAATWSAVAGWSDRDSCRHLLERVSRSLMPDAIVPHGRTSHMADRELTDSTTATPALSRLVRGRSRAQRPNVAQIRTKRLSTPTVWLLYMRGRWPTPGHGRRGRLRQARCRAFLCGAARYQRRRGRRTMVGYLAHGLGAAAAGLPALRRRQRRPRTPPR